MLEIILHKYFGLDEDWNDDYEKAHTNWNKSYQELVDLIYDLDELGVLNGDKVVDELDIIDSGEFGYDEETKKLRDILFDVLNRNRIEENAKEELVVMRVCGELTTDEYDIILENYDEWKVMWHNAQHI